MKKKIAIAVCVLAVFAAIIAFAKSDKSDTDITTTVAAVEEDEGDYTPEIVNGTKNPNKLIKITMPLSHFDALNQADLSGFFNKNSYENCKINEKNKTFTITVKSITHDFMLSNVGLQVIKNLASLLDSEEYPYIKGLGNYNSDFSEIELLVDGEQYKADESKEDVTSFVASCGIFYQLYTTENEYKCTVIIKDKESDKVIDRYIAREDNSGLKS